MVTDVEEAYASHGPMVLRRCRKLLRDEGRALDAMHDVFIQLMRREDEVEPGRMGPLLLRIATNVCLNLLRSARRRPEDPTDEAVLEIARLEEGADGVVAARQLLGRIFGRETASTREIAVMHLLDGMTMEEIGREVGLSVSGVRKRLRTLRSRVAALEGVSP
ncbi:MAG: sigma-70 family RNA polymerase sigma factor [Deltaproteobacteria bacterium]|nr:sigma-70 family RNA polymerase sigma factor [Deltaproteobacteria bacterium]